MVTKFSWRHNTYLWISNTLFNWLHVLFWQNKYPKLSIDEIEMGETLGKGSFGIAYECKVAFGARYFGNTKTLSSRSIMTDCTDLDSSDDDDMSQHDDCSLISNHCQRGGEQDGEEGSARYAIKMLHKDAVENPEMLIRGSIDMAVEARILSSIDHPNVVKIYASGKTPYEANYFIGKKRLPKSILCTQIDTIEAYSSCTNHSIFLYSHG